MRDSVTRTAALVTVFMASSALASTAHAQVPIPPVGSCTNYILIEAGTGLVLAERDADTPRAPASMVKMMQMLMVAEGLDQGRWTLEDPVIVSPEAARIGGSQAHLRPGENTTLGALIGAVSVNSANDAAMAVAEALWSSRDAYLEAGNARARELGMIDTTIYSVHGLPPEQGRPYDRTTARDMAILAQWCAQHPRVMEWVGMPEFQFRETENPRSNTNRLLGRMQECDGLKTGYTRAAGWCLAATAVRDGIRLIVVVMGCETVGERFDAAEALLEYGFADVRKLRMLAAGSPVDPPLAVHNCATPVVHARTTMPLYAVVKASEVDRLQVEPVVERRIEPPLEAGAEVGIVRVTVDGEVRGHAPLVITESLQPAGWRWKLERAANGEPDRAHAALSDSQSLGTAGS